MQINSKKSKSLDQNDTRKQILKIARSYIQTCGFHALSFQMIADDMGIKKPSLFHHFSSKEDLGIEVIQQYHDWFDRWKNEVQDIKPTDKLKGYFEIFETFSLDHGKICPMGAMSIDLNSLPESMQKSLKKLSLDHLGWLEETLAQGKKQKSFSFQQKPLIMAEILMSAIQGALIISRVQADKKYFLDIKKSLLSMVV